MELFILGMVKEIVKIINLELFFHLGKQSADKTTDIAAVKEILYSYIYRIDMHYV